MKILTETASKWGNLYELRYYLDGQRIPNEEAHRLFDEHDPKQISSNRITSGWRTEWEIPTC